MSCQPVLFAAQRRGAAVVWQQQQRWRRRRYPAGAQATGSVVRALREIRCRRAGSGELADGEEAVHDGSRTSEK